MYTPAFSIFVYFWVNIARKIDRKTVRWIEERNMGRVIFDMVKGDIDIWRLVWRRIGIVGDWWGTSGTQIQNQNENLEAGQPVGLVRGAHLHHHWSSWWCSFKPWSAVAETLTVAMLATGNVSHTVDNDVEEYSTRRSCVVICRPLLGFEHVQGKVQT